MQQSILPQLHGVVPINKPVGMSSNHCLMQIKRLGQKKIGHAGTLDPMASGVLLILLGQATKISSYLLQEGGKIYSGALTLGVTTDTWDKEGRILEEKFKMLDSNLIVDEENLKQMTNTSYYVNLLLKDFKLYEKDFVEQSTNELNYRPDNAILTRTFVKRIPGITIEKDIKYY